jgi:hypothetical protein
MLPLLHDAMRHAAWAFLTEHCPIKIHAGGFSILNDIRKVRRSYNTPSIYSTYLTFYLKFLDLSHHLRLNLSELSPTEPI